MYLVLGGQSLVVLERLHCLLLGRLEVSPFGFGSRIFLLLWHCMCSIVIVEMTIKFVFLFFQGDTVMLETWGKKAVGFMPSKGFLRVTPRRSLPM